MFHAAMLGRARLFSCLKYPVLVHLYNKQPKYVLFSMGLNDVNLTTKEQFVENYMQLLYRSAELYSSIFSFLQNLLRTGVTAIIMNSLFGLACKR